MTLSELRKAAFTNLNEIYAQTPRGRHGLEMGAKAKRLLALFEAEPEHRKYGHRELLEERAAEIAHELKQSVLYSYHVVQAYFELFNEREDFRAATHAKVSELRVRARK